MTVSFPSNPNNGDTYLYNGTVFVFDGVKWVSGGATAYASSAQGELAETAVQRGGDNMTGDLTLGTDKITLDATDGYGFFGNDPTERVVIYGTDGQITIRNDSNGFGGTPAEAFGVYRAGAAVENQTVSIRSDGEAIFGGRITNSNGVHTQNVPSTSGAFAVLDSNGDAISLIKGDGSAYFANTVTSSPVGAYAFSIGDTAQPSGGLYIESDSSGSLYLSPGAGQSAKVNIKGGSGDATFAGTGVFSDYVSAGTDQTAYGLLGYSNSSNPGHSAIYARQFNANGNALYVEGYNGGQVFNVTGEGGVNAKSFVRTESYLYAQPAGGNYAGIYNYQTGTTSTIAYEQRNAASTQTTLLYYDGSAYYAGAINGTVVGTSDIKFKENITVANPQLDDVVALGNSLKNFNWKDNAPLNEEQRGKRFLGLIAQEAEAICPGLITEVEGLGEDKESYKTINHDILVMKLLGAVAELKAELDELKGA